MIHWNDVNDSLPEDHINTNDLSIECLVHTNKGHFVTNRVHDICVIPVEVSPNTLESKKVDRGWYWEIEVGNSCRNIPTNVEHWVAIEAKYD